MTDRGACCPPTPPYARPSFPLAPHIVLRLRARPRRQKLLHHPNMTSLRSPMQRRPSILRRAKLVRQAPPLSAQDRAPPPAPAPPSVPNLHSTSKYGRAGAYGSAFRQFPPEFDMLPETKGNAHLVKKIRCSNVLKKTHFQVARVTHPHFARSHMLGISQTQGRVLAE